GAPLLAGGKGFPLLAPDDEAAGVGFQEERLKRRLPGDFKGDGVSPPARFQVEGGGDALHGGAERPAVTDRRQAVGRGAAAQRQPAIPGGKIDAGSSGSSDGVERGPEGPALEVNAYLRGRFAAPVFDRDPGLAGEVGQDLVEGRVLKLHADGVGTRRG